MSRPLSPVLPFDDAETPLSWASRLAAFHTGAAVGSFLNDLGLSIGHLALGREAATRRLAVVGGADPDRVLRNRVERLAALRFKVRGETVYGGFAQSLRTFVCPRCLVDDLAGRTRPDLSRMRARFAWMLGVVRSCPIHEIRLVDIVGRRLTGQHNNLARHAAENWRAVRTAADAASTTTVSPVQSYALDRLEGLPGPDWLDSQPIDLAVRSCELLGAVAMRGARPKTSRFTPEERDEADRLGFAIAAEGEAGVRALLARLQSTCRTTDGHAGPQAMFGVLWEAMTRGSEQRDRGPLEAVMRRHIRETMPLAAGETLLGETIEVRRVHSVRTLAQETGLHPKRLRKMLHARGLIDPGEARLPDNRLFFDAAAGVEVARTLMDTVPLGAVPVRLGVGRPFARALIAAGILQPVTAPDAGRALKEFRIAVADLDALAARALAGAGSGDDVDGVFVTLQAASMIVKRPPTDILSAVLDGRLVDRRRQAAGVGLGQLLVSRAELLAVFAPAREDRDYAPYRAAARLKTTLPVVMALIADRPGGAILFSRPAPNNRSAAARMIPKAALDSFGAAHVSLIALARERGVHHLRLAVQLRALGIEPAFDRKEAKATFYRRDQLPADI